MSVARGFEKPARTNWSPTFDRRRFRSVALNEQVADAAIGEWRHGYKETSPVVGFVVNRGAALLLLLMAWPLLLTISVALFATQGRKIIYRGERLGRNKETFDIFKFRTLDSDRAAKLTVDQVLPTGSNLETPLGGWLRDSRLDELPQLFNVLNGTMVLFGPRPVRPSIAAIHSSEIENYDVRFEVTPGLVGFSQALMSHGTSKRLRARFNNRLCRRPVNHLSNLIFVLRVGLAVLRKSATKLIDATRPGQRPVTSDDRDAYYLIVDGMWYQVSVRGEDMLEADVALPEASEGRRLRLARQTKKGGLRSTAIRVVGNRWTGRRSFVRMEPVSEASLYFLERYFSERVVLPTS